MALHLNYGIEFGGDFKLVFLLFGKPYISRPLEGNKKGSLPLRKGPFKEINGTHA